MTALQDQIDQWCAGVPGLEKVGDRSWAFGASSNVSYPADDLAILSQIEDKSYWFNHRNAIISAVVRRFPPSGPIFDIGGGNGYVSLGLQAAGFSTIVVEPDAAGIATARRRGLSTIQAAFQNLAISPNSIPAAGLFDVLEHIEAEEETLRRLHDALQPGGRAYVAVPAYDFLWSAEDVHAGHFRRYTVARLKQAMQKAGFTPEFGTFFFSALVPAIFAFRTLPTLFRLRNGENTTSSKEHLLPDSLLGRMLRRSLARELQAVEAGNGVGFGSSALVAARKE